MGSLANRYEASLKRLFLFALISVITGWLSFSVAQSTDQPETQPETPSCTAVLSIDGVVSPGTLDYLQRGFARSRALGCLSNLILINTPGGNLQSTRLIVEKILASPVPVLCLVSPSGGHAGSAGALILLACHVSGAEPATNIGAATPVTMTGMLPDDLRAKMIQDTVSWAKSLAQLRGRNTDFAERIVTESLALDANEAAKINAIDFVSIDTNRFLETAVDREVTMSGGVKDRVRVGAMTSIERDLRASFLEFVTDPEVAYLIFLASLALLFAEITHFGLLVPGVIGAIGLLISLISFHKLDVRWGSLGLIGLGMVMSIAEAFVPSFGALGVGGLAAIGLGSFMLFDPAISGMSLSLPLVLTVTGLLGSGMLALAFVSVRTLRMGKAQTETTLIGRTGEVSSIESPSLRRGMLSVAGEFWHFTSIDDVQVGSSVEILAQEGLNLKVKSQKQNRATNSI